MEHIITKIHIFQYKGPYSYSRRHATPKLKMLVKNDNLDSNMLQMILAHSSTSIGVLLMLINSSSKVQLFGKKLICDNNTMMIKI